MNLISDDIYIYIYIYIYRVRRKTHLFKIQIFLFFSESFGIFVVFWLKTLSSATKKHDKNRLIIKQKLLDNKSEKMCKLVIMQ